MFWSNKNDNIHKSEAIQINRPSDKQTLTYKKYQDVWYSTLFPYKSQQDSVKIYPKISRIINMNVLKILVSGAVMAVSCLGQVHAGPSGSWRAKSSGGGGNVCMGGYHWNGMRCEFNGR